MFRIKTAVLYVSSWRSCCRSGMQRVQPPSPCRPPSASANLCQFGVWVCKRWFSWGVETWPGCSMTLSHLLIPRYTRSHTHIQITCSYPHLVWLIVRHSYTVRVTDLIGLPGEQRQMEAHVTQQYKKDISLAQSVSVPYHSLLPLPICVTNRDLSERRLSSINAEQWINGAFLLTHAL